MFRSQKAHSIHKKLRALSNRQQRVMLITNTGTVAHLFSNASDIRRFFMAKAESQKPSCPMCKQADQVKTMREAYDAGVARCAPPDMPTKNISMSRTIFFCSLLVGICIFSIIVLIGSEANLGPIFDGILGGITLICIITTLVLSYTAFNRVVKGDAEATLRFPAWDEATAIWKSLYYCSRDNLVFDPNTERVLPEEELATLRSLDNQAPEVVSASFAR
jgi:hypothetical protein